MSSSLLRSGVRAATLLPDSFIARARAAKDPGVLLGRFRSAGCFDKCLEGMTCTEVGEDSVTCSLVVDEALANNIGSLHGAAIATIVDVVGTMALLAKDPTRAGVSVEMNQCFVSAARIGEQLELTGRVLGYGRSLGYTEILVHKPGVDGAEPKLVATGRHTKFMKVN